MTVSRMQKFMALCDKVRIHMPAPIIEEYDIDVYRFNDLTKRELITMFQKICKTRANKNIQKMWIQNQLKVFIWIAIKHVQYWRKSDCEFTMLQWAFLAQFFYQKDPRVCKYFMKQAHKVIVSEDFQCEEDQLLLYLVRKQQGKKIKWSSIALQIYLESQQRFFKKSKRYRQRYINYLDDTVYRQEWKHSEQSHMINLVAELGKKWSKIGKILNNRTQNSVKNHYNRLLIRTQKHFHLAIGQLSVHQEINIIKRFHKLQKAQQKHVPITVTTQLPKQEDVTTKEQCNYFQNPLSTLTLSPFSTISPYQPFAVVSSYSCISPLTQFITNSSYMPYN